LFISKGVVAKLTHYMKKTDKLRFRICAKIYQMIMQFFTKQTRQ